MVRSTKRCLRKTLRNAKLNFEELMTILTEIEGVLNSRPLTYSCEELGEPLTPAHLIIGRRILDKPTPLSFESGTDLDADTTVAHNCHGNIICSRQNFNLQSYYQINFNGINTTLFHGTNTFSRHKHFFTSQTLFSRNKHFFTAQTIFFTAQTIFSLQNHKPSS